MPDLSLASRLDGEGFALVAEVFDRGRCAAFAERSEALTRAAVGTRRLLDQAWCRALADEVLVWLESLGLNGDHVAMQCTLFEKSAATNWLVPVHQDLLFPVAERVDHPDLLIWSEKEGTLFVQPPVDVLERLLAIRIHLDPCGVEDGALRIVPGSHRRGVIARADAITARAQEVVGPAGVGDVVLMKPLALHGSSKARAASRRRVLHFLVGPRDLPYGLRPCVFAAGDPVRGVEGRLR